MIEKIVITNIKAIEFAEFKVGALTVLTGGNGTGKTSVIDAVTAVFESGHNPDLIRKGAEFGRVELYLSGGETITATVKPTTTSRVVKDENGKVVPAPATHIAALASSFAFDPLGFLTAPAKERAAWLAAVMPIAVTTDEVTAFLPNPKTKAKVVAMLPQKPMDIDGIAAARLSIYKERTGENAIAKRLSLTVDSLQSAVGGEDETDWAGRVEADAGALAVARSQRDAINADRERMIGNFGKASVLEAQSSKEHIAAEAIRRVAEIKAEAESAYAKIDANLSTAVESYRAEVEAAAREELAKANVTIETLQESFATAKGKAEQQARNENTRKLLESTRAEYCESMAKATLLDHAVEALDKAKAKALSATPIAGLELANGEVIYKGIKFDHLNTQQQYELAISIGSERLGKLAIMVTDYGEHLDPKKWEELKQAILDSGIQFIVARVTEGSLEIQSVKANGSALE